MDLATFQGLLQQCGTDLDAWPGDSGAAALHLMAVSDAAREAYLAAFPGVGDRPVDEGAADPLVERIMRALAGDQG